MGGRHRLEDGVSRAWRAKLAGTRDALLFHGSIATILCWAIHATLGKDRRAASGARVGIAESLYEGLDAKVGDGGGKLGEGSVGVWRLRGRCTETRMCCSWTRRHALERQFGSMVQQALEQAVKENGGGHRPHVGGSRARHYGIEGDEVVGKGTTSGGHAERYAELDRLQREGERDVVSGFTFINSASGSTIPSSGRSRASCRCATKSL